MWVDEKKKAPITEYLGWPSLSQILASPQEFIIGFPFFFDDIPAQFKYHILYSVYHLCLFAEVIGIINKDIC